MAINTQGKTIPQNPGVYFFSAKNNKILYIGKAANLRIRLRSYFAKHQTSLKTAAMLKEAKKLSWETVNSETEALIREAELIKKYRPKYNVLMRDDKQYLYVGFTVRQCSRQAKEKFQRIFVTHQTQAIKADYIGPFTESGTLKTVLKMLRRIFPYCTCKQLHDHPCLNARIGRCLGFCCLPEDVTRPLGRVTSKLYQNNIRAIKKILSGKNKSLLLELKKEMRRFSKEGCYEEAAKVRDQIRALEHIFEHRGIVRQELPTQRAKALHVLEQLLDIAGIHRIEGYDISNINGHYAYGSMVVFIDGIPAKDQYRIFKIHLDVAHPSDLDVQRPSGSNDPAMIHEVVARRLKHQEWPYPDVMLIDGGKAQLNAAKQALDLFSQQVLNPNLPAITVISLAKREEELYLPHHQQPIKLKQSSESLYSLLTHIRNEAHRFAIQHYRKAHRIGAGH